MTTLRRHALPQEPNAFVGRDHDLDEVAALVASHSVVTLCGVGGIGKSRMALKVAERAADTDVRLVELADATRSELVARLVAAACGITEEAGQPLVATMREALLHRSLLLILDNCEHLVDACAALTQALLVDCPDLRVLVTSREPLRIPGEVVWRVPPLELPAGDDDIAAPEAVRLFTERAAATGSGFRLTPENAPAVARLCAELDGMPLALELAAARVSVLAVEQIAERIADRFRLLTSGDRTAHARQRTLRATVDWSHELLSGRERVLLRRLSVFAGGFTLDTAEAVAADADVPESEVLDLLAGLVDKSLIGYVGQVAGEARYRMLETIRHYAAERLAESGEERLIRRRHLGVMAALAEKAQHVSVAPVLWERRMEVLNVVVAEMPNYRAAFDWAIESRDAEGGLRMVAGMRTFWLLRGERAEQGRRLRDLLAMDASDVDPGLLGVALTACAEMALVEGDPEAAWTCGERAIELARSAGDEAGLRSATLVLAGVELRRGEADRAAGRLRVVVLAAQEGGDRWDEGVALGLLATAARARGQLREAQDHAEASLRAMRAIDQRWGAARTLIALARIAEARGDLPAARARYEEALPSLSGSVTGIELARCLIGLGRVAVREGDHNVARAHLWEGLTRSRACGWRIGIARGLEGYAALASAEERHAEAVRLTGAAAALREAVGSGSGDADRHALIERARRHVADVDRLLAEGRAMNTREAVALALDEEGTVAANEPDPDRGPRPPAGGPLTPREREIVALISRGLSNKAIAEELVISPATAARHVANILLKLGLRSRAQVAVWAAQHEIGG